MSTEWLATNVAPSLTQDNRHTYDLWQIGNALIGFMGEKPEIWAYYADYDWVALCQIFGTMLELPDGWPMYCRDVKQLCDERGNPRNYVAVSPTAVFLVIHTRPDVDN